jgi:Methyltransferase domain
MDGFRYTPRQSCVCGAPLRDLPPEVKRDYSWGVVTFAHCPACGSYLQSPQIEESSLAQWYDSPDYQGSDSQAGAGYHNYFADEDARVIEARGRYEGDLMPFLPAGARILEVGCATGSLLSVLREAGHTVSGVDLVQKFCQIWPRAAWPGCAMR